MLNKNALLVYSGGQDSSTCLFWAKKNFDSLNAIVFDYGQRHRSEINAAETIAYKAGIRLELAKIDIFTQFSKSALINRTIEVEDYHADILNPPNTLVEGRNLLFITYAAIYAKQIGADNLILGVGQTDYSGYPDCRNEFIQSANTTINLAFDHEFKIHTPLMWKTKAETWQMADELGVISLIREHTVSCYQGIPGSGCGKCPACVLRRLGYEEYLLNIQKLK